MSSAADMSLMDLFFDQEDPVLKNGFKEEIMMDADYNDPLTTESWPTPTDEFLDSMLKLEHPFNLMENDVDALPSSSSDSGLSSALSLSCEQQLSPLLPIEDQLELSNDNQSSPQNFTDFQYLGSPNDSVGSFTADSPVRSVMSSNVGSPGTDMTEEMDFESNYITAVDPNVVEGSIETPVQLIKQEPQPVIEFNSAPKQPVKKQETTLNLRNITCNGKRNIRQLIRVTPVGSGNPRSILLPVSLKDMKEVRTIKIINATQARNLKGFKLNPGNVISKAIPVNIKHEDTSSEKSSIQSGDEVSETEFMYPPLILTPEEKRLLAKEGISLPSHYPLTKNEERELKRVRRKIRNKVSAQDSRKRKKEYVDSLEDRVKQDAEAKMNLSKRIKVLESTVESQAGQIKSQAGQIKRLLAIIQNRNKNAQPATCLMVLLLSLALVAVPNLRPHSNNSSELRKQESKPITPPLAGRSRSLLFTKQLVEEEFQQYSEELLQEVESLLDHDYSPIQVSLYKPPSRYDVEQKANNNKLFTGDLSGGMFARKSEFADVKLSKKYIEPPLDDVWPPPKPDNVQAVKVLDKLEAITNELKINISDTDGTRTVVLKVPQEI
ncbi:cyclic AMP-responsive element-binding protein 3-like protein 2 [Microplitis mediator]|uniref:cyclic AMP-responsive element-binding protein 3-like protein 2 n=1 Tax=Microplitis mediator TaxID=375433 RepID=UPI002557084F|nr:cyclic AMP-responsive element-binding protein 3-like protein 2 [Microplitis mediator]